MESKHFWASRLHTYTADPLLFMYFTASCARDVAVVVPRPFLKPNCVSAAVSSGRSNFSTIFECTELSVIGLKLLGSFEQRVAFFKIGTIIPTSKISGTVEVAIMAVYNSH